MYLPFAEYLTGELEEPFGAAALHAYPGQEVLHLFSAACSHSVDRMVHCVALLDEMTTLRLRPVGMVV